MGGIIHVQTIVQGTSGEGVEKVYGKGNRAFPDH